MAWTRALSSPGEVGAVATRGSSNWDDARTKRRELALFGTPAANWTTISATPMQREIFTTVLLAKNLKKRYANAVEKSAIIFGSRLPGRRRPSWDSPVGRRPLRS